METKNEDEKWLPVEGFEGIYEVSNMGRVRSMRAHYNTWVGRILTPVPNSKGYFGVALYRDGKRHYGAVHILVARAFCQRSEERTCVNHKHGIVTDNRATELEWCTHKENTAHAYKTGLMAPLKGASNGASILTQEKVDEIRRRYAAGGIPMRVLAEEFGVINQTIWCVIRRKTWA